MKTEDLNIKEMREQLRKELDSKRYEHTMGVAYTAAALAMAYHYNVDKALVAGLLHDCAKCMKKQDREDYCKKYKIHLTKEEKMIPALQHAKIGSYYCETKYQVKDQDIKNAILYHTTGKPDMNMLEKIIFIADYIEPNRMPLPKISKIREMAFHDLDVTMEMILKNILNYLNETGGAVDPMTQTTYDYYRRDAS